MNSDTRLVQLSTVAKPDRRWWGFSSKSSKDLSKLFSIGLYDLQENSYLDLKNGVFDLPRKLGVSEGGKEAAVALYYFTTPPQSYEISEPSSVQIVPTQDGGKFVESQGSLFKDIRLAGTVGFRPGPQTNELFPGLEAAGGPSLTVPSILTPKDDRGLNPKEVTGFDELIFLRNLFRFYWDIKSNSDYARRIVMIFMYQKESEIYIVEPLNFTTTRDKSSPLSWRYNITLRTMYRFDYTVSYVKDSLNLFQQLSNIASTIRKISQSISKSLHEIAGLINYLANLPANLLNDVLSFGMDILSGMAAVKNAGASFSDTVTKTLVNTLRNSANELKRMFDDKYQAEGVDTPDVLMAGDIGVVRSALTSIVKDSESLLSMDSLWETSKQVQIEDYSKAYYDEYGEPPYNAGSPLTLQNIKFPESATEVEVMGGEDIRALSKRYLGDEAKWKMLAIMNNLRPPYISTQVGDGVLGPGSKILIPKSESVERSEVSRAINTDQSMEDQSRMMRKYGRDIMLSDGASGTDVADLHVGQNGDLQIVEGVDNVSQAMMIKFSTEQGELATHPDFGAKYPVGTKITLVRIQEFLLTTRKTFLSDPRIESILSLRIMAEGDKVFTSSKLKLKNTNQELPITFAVRR